MKRNEHITTVEPGEHVWVNLYIFALHGTILSILKTNTYMITTSSSSMDLGLVPSSTLTTGSLLHAPSLR